MKSVVKIGIMITLINAGVIIFGMAISATWANPAKIIAAKSSTQITPSITSSTPSKPNLPSPTPDDRCIIRVRGQLFDISGFKSIHSGGDIFECGNDMTEIFNAQHNDQIFTLLQRYKI